MHDLIGRAIDSVLPEEKKRSFRDHLSACRICRSDYEIEQTSKNLVQHHLHHVQTPTDVYQFVQRSLHVEQLSVSGSLGWLEGLITKRALAPALGVILLFAATLYLSQTTSGPADQLTVHTASNDIINQTFRNFTRIRSGELKPTMVSCYPEGVLGFFEKDDLKFAVNIMSLEGCDWYGAIRSEFDGVKLAHVVYKIGDDTMYVYQVDEEEAMNGNILTLPPAAKEALAKTGWYTDPSHPDCNVVLWKKGGTLCSAISNMNKDRLFAFLTTH